MKKAVVYTFLCFSALSVYADSESEKYEMLAGAVKLSANQAAKACFSDVQIMLAGFAFNEKGLSIQEVADLASIKDKKSKEFRMIEVGFTLSGPMDPKIGKEFSSCIDAAL